MIFSAFTISLVSHFLNDLLVCGRIPIYTSLSLSLPLSSRGSCSSDIFFYRISSSHIFNSVRWSHALVNGPTSKRPASDGGRCSGQLLMMWSAVCSGSPHSHVALSASPHFFMEALYRPTQFAVCLGSSSVFDSVLLPWRLLLGPIRGGVPGWVRMLPTPVSTLPQSTHPSTGPQGWHLASPEPPCCRVYATWVCMGAFQYLSCRTGCASRISLFSVPRREWLLSALGRQGLSLLRQGAGTQVSACDNQIWSAESCWLRRQRSSRVGFCSR